MWKRPLTLLAASGFTWNIAKPDFKTVLHGALFAAENQQSYNGKGWYPRPDAKSEVRGMEILSRALASRVCDLRLNHKVESLDLLKHTVTTTHGDEKIEFQFDRCISTIPLPILISRCSNAPETLKQACSTLLRNRVFTGMFAIRGPRPNGRGHWRYYADESVIFTRVIYMHEFDPDSSPEDGWGLMVEITEPAEAPTVAPQKLLSRTEEDLWRTGVLSAEDEILARDLLLVDPAYVVFTNESMAIVDQARQFLESHNIHCLGRYGRWEYSSMSQVMTDGFELARRLSHSGAESDQDSK